jgi:hypothetical protein
VWLIANAVINRHLAGMYRSRAIMADDVRDLS